MPGGGWKGPKLPVSRCPWVRGDGLTGAALFFFVTLWAGRELKHSVLVSGGSPR